MKVILTLATAIFLPVCLLAQAPTTPPKEELDETPRYRIIGEHAVDGRYSGEATLHKKNDTFQLDWQFRLGDSKPLEVSARGLLYGRRMVAGFGERLRGLAVFVLQDGDLTGRGFSMEAPEIVQPYLLKHKSGTSAAGVYHFVDGDTGTLTLKARDKQGLISDAVWEGKDGTRQGLAFWTGEVLQVAIGEGSGTLGIASYSLGLDDALHGVWSSGEHFHLETLVPETGQQRGVADPRTLPFDRQGFYLARSKSDIGAPISEQRDYLRAGESFENRVKQVSIAQYQISKYSASDIADGLVATAKEKPGFISSTSLGSTPEQTGFTLLMKEDGKYTFIMAYVVRLEGLLTSTQFIVRNEGDISDEGAFMQHIEEKLPVWKKDLHTLSTSAPYFLRLTASMPPMDTARIPK